MKYFSSFDKNFEECLTSLSTFFQSYRGHLSSHWYFYALSYSSPFISSRLNCLLLFTFSMNHYSSVNGYSQLFFYSILPGIFIPHLGVHWLSGRVLDSRPRGCVFEPHRHHYAVSLSKTHYPCLQLVQRTKSNKQIVPHILLTLSFTCPFITERLLMGPKESNQTKQKALSLLSETFVVC